MPGWVQQHADILLWLVVCEFGSECNRVGHGGVEISHLKIEVHHCSRLPFDGRPDGRHVAVRLLEDEIDRPLGRSDDGGAWLLMSDRPVEQLGIELCKGARIGRILTPPATPVGWELAVPHRRQGQLAEAAVADVPTFVGTSVMIDSMRDILTVRETLEQLSSLLDDFRNGATEPVSIGSRRHREAVLVPVALWDALVSERRQIAEQTDASLRLEGDVRSEAARAISERYVKGDIDANEMVRLTILLHSPKGLGR